MSQLYLRKPQNRSAAEADNFVTDDSLSNFEIDNNKTNLASGQSTSHLNKKHWIFIILLKVCIYYCCYAFDSLLLPEPLTDDQAGQHRFSEVRARRHLTEMTSYGPKPSGSYAAEILTRNYIEKELEEIKAGLNSRAHSLDISVQKPTDCFDFNLPKGNIMLCYKNITNIVALLRPKPLLTDFSILVNCHFDSVPSSPGATDDLSSCSIMLEMLSVMSKSEKSFAHNVIFLFNGAEENWIQASHGFITQHKLRHTVKAFINLEGAGAGGREFLFQSGPANMWMLHAYLDSATRPHGTVMAQEIFESGVALSFTDYQIFRDYGRLSGLDIAYVKNGYLYHTEFDKAEYIPLGSLQRCGDNVLATLITMANSPCIVTPCPALEEKLIFFDILGLFVIHYPLTYATVMHYTICILVLLKIFNQFRLSKMSFNQFNNVKEKKLMSKTSGYTVRNFISQSFIHLIGFISMVLSLLLMVKMVHILGLTLCWYSKPILILPLYVMPPILVGFFVHIYLPKRFRLLHINDLYQREQVTFDVSLSLMAIMLFVLTYLGLRVTYLVFVFTAFPMLRDVFLSLLLKLFGSCQRNASLLYSCHVIALAPASLLAAYSMFEILTFFIPLMGRSGLKMNPELFIAGIGGLSAFLVVLFYVSLAHISRGVGYLMKCCAALFIFTIIIITVTSLGSPYKFDIEGPRWRQLHLQHLRRRITLENGHKIDETGIWIAPSDYRGVQDLPVDPFLQGSKPPFCLAADAFCGLPFYRARRDIVNSTLWLSVPEAPPVKPVSLQMLSKEEISSTILNYTFSVHGADHVTLFVTPVNSWKIDSWTFADSPVHYQQTYFIYLANVDTDEPWTFSLQISNKDNKTVDNSKLLIGAASHYLHGEYKLSKRMETIMNTVKKRRMEPELTKNHWKWAMTVDGWSSDYLAQYFN